MREPPLRSVDELLADSSLSPDTCDAIRQVVRDARLWPSERLDLAEELVAHFLDGRDAGIAEQVLLDAFGDRALAAALIRRARVRTRPALWHAARAALLATLVLAAVAALAYVHRATSLRLSAPRGWNVSASDPGAASVDELLVRYRTALAEPDASRSVASLRAAAASPVTRQRLLSYRALDTPAQRAAYLNDAWSGDELDVVQRAADQLTAHARDALDRGAGAEAVDDLKALAGMRQQLAALETPRGDLAAFHVELEWMRLSDDGRIAPLRPRLGPAIELAGTRRYFRLLLDSLYGADGQLTGEGIELVRNMKGWHAPSRLDRWMEPGWYLFPASAREAARRFDQLLRNAELGDPGRPPTDELEALLGSTWQCLRHPALSAVGRPLHRLLQLRWETTRRRHT